MIRVLVTSTSHPAYNQTGRIVRDLRSQGVEIRLDSTGHRTLVPEGQWKITSIQEPSERERQWMSEEDAMSLAQEAQSAARQED